MQASYPYDKYKLYGPYFHKVEKRNYVMLVSKEHRSTTAYARYLMAVHLKRILAKEEQVDHIDGNCLNDVLDNLQLLSRLDNIKKSIVQNDMRRCMVKLQCPNCGKIFSKERRNTHLVITTRKFTSCSRHCMGIIACKLQMGVNCDLSSNVIELFKV